MLNIESVIKEFQTLPKECEWVEFKVNNADPQELGEYISALANSACYHNQPYGYLVFGIEDESHRIVGTKFRPKQEKIKGQEIENWLATQLTPRIDFSIHEVSIEGFPVCLFKIDATINTPVTFIGKSYIRIGSYKKLLHDHPERQRKIWNKTLSRSFEKNVALENVTGEQACAILDYTSFFELLAIKLPVTVKAILEKLAQEKIVIVKGKDLYDITNLGAILFSRNIEVFETLARKAVRVIFYDGENKTKTLREQVGKKGYASGFEGLITYINERLPSNEEIGKAFRKEVSVYPPLAIRELVANALIHQDFNVSGTSPMIEVFKSRIEITNPGNPLIDPQRFIDHSPESRNELLAGFMRRMNICEERGSGIDKVIFECELYQLPAPQFIAGDNYTRIILYAPRSLRKMDKQDKIRACYQHCSLKYVSGEIMTNETLRQRFGIDPKNYSMASRIIAETIDAGFIKYYDMENKSKKYAKYIPSWA